MKELRAFRIHPHLLRDVIERQAGTVEKACLEGVMNSIEAGSTAVTVNLDHRSISIRDDGRGFQLQEELENFFETFGQPHDQKEKKIWAEFRMGRGQMFAFGKNTWRTGTFRMVIDLRGMTDELHYELETGLENVPGCEIKIDLYTPLTDRDIFYTTNQIARFVKYVEIPVEVNDRIVSKSPTLSQWTSSNDDAFIRITEGGLLQVYNLGVLVCDFSQGKYGLSGVIVSKQRLKVNFARNDIISNCPVWARIRKLVDERGAQQVKRKTSLTDGEREALIHRFVSGDAKPMEYQRTKLFPDITGTVWSVNAIKKQGFTTWSVAESFNRTADILIQQGTCLVFSSSILDLFDVADNPDRLFERFDFGWMQVFQFVPFDTISATIDDRAVDLPIQSWSPTERVWLLILTGMYDSMYRGSRSAGGEYPSHRLLKIGRSDDTLAWTDGRTYITVSREFLADNPLFDQHTGLGRIRSIVRAAQVLAHEFCHDGEDCLTSLHGPEFDQAYRKMDSAIADAVVRAMSIVTPKWREASMKRAKELWRSSQGRKASPEEAEAADSVAAMTVSHG